MEQKKKKTKKLGPYMRGKDQVRPLPELGNTLPPPLTSISMVPPTYTFTSAAESEAVKKSIFRIQKYHCCKSGFRNACFKMDEIKQWWTWTFTPYIPPGQLCREAQSRFLKTVLARLEVDQAPSAYEQKSQVGLRLTPSFPANPGLFWPPGTP